MSHNIIDIKNKVYKTLPSVIKTILLNSNGYLVGSAVENIVSDNEIKDYDIIVPDRELYMSVIRSLSSTCEFTTNTFGGMKFTDKKYNIEIDIWCEELSHFLSNTSKVKYIYYPKRSQIIEVG